MFTLSRAPWHRDWPSPQPGPGFRPLGKALSQHPGTGPLQELGHCFSGPRERAVSCLRPSRLWQPPPLFQPEPGAGNIRELTLVPTGDSLGTEPSPNQQEMTPQPGHPLGGRVSLPVLFPAQLTPQWGPGSQAQPRPLLHAPWATPAGTGVTDAWPPQLTPTMSNRAPQTQGPWLRRKGCMRSRGTEVGKGAQSQGCQEGEKRQRLAEGSGKGPQALL